ncbi:hypothetical protein ACIRN4_24080 [Pimelobacter simplex]|uniref:Uncharacterized protein n=1 Tax=Nocardioides simplex TaxID=2045 RepID=A0A7J5DVQ8_NOCSI|nr:hypothetical protein [Pimelobacter simplex]KAB2809414.1 hypothetical protein F9L07_20510 [Pimelobacter simplex]
MFAELGTRLAGALSIGDLKTDGAPAQGLDLVVEQIKGVLTALDQGITDLEANKFPVDGFIRSASFGMGEEASRIAYHHTRAHGVVVDTLKGMKSDLEKFHASVLDAQALVTRTDEQAQADLTRIVARTENIDLGQQGHVDAQNDHTGDVPSDEPPAADDSDETDEDAS